MQYYNFDCGCRFPLITEKPLRLKLDIEKAPLTCKRTWDMISQGLTKGVFQLESNLGRSWTKKLKPESIEHLAALGALLRPGCISQNTKIAWSTRSKGLKLTKIETLYNRWIKRKNRPRVIISVNEANNTLVKNKIDNIIYTGKKEVYTLKLRINLKDEVKNRQRFDLQCTLDHMLLTNNGWKELQFLLPGDRIAVVNHNRTENGGRHRFRNICFRNYVYKCVFCDWKDGSLDVNHIDGNRKIDNSIDNLSFLCPNHHRMYTEGKINKEELITARSKYKLYISKDIIWAEYIDKTLLGIKNTYDIKVTGPNHNFIAGNVVVHNCLRAIDENGISTTEHYCLRKNNQEPVTFFHPSLEPILKTTFGVMAYQEQAMAIARLLALFTPQEADELRKAIGKKLPEEMAKVEIKFIAKAKEANIVNEEEARQIFDWIKESQRYSFNKCSHKDTIIKRPNGGRYGSGEYTLEHMYNIRNNIQYAKSHKQLSLYKKWKLRNNYGRGLSLCTDGRIRPNTILDIQPAGKQKVYLIELENGSTISTTINHKFPTPHGEKTLSELTIGSYIYICGTYQKSDFKILNRFSNGKRNIYGKSGKGCCGQENRWFSNGSYSEFVKNDKIIDKVCAICKKSDLETRLELHHKDGNRADSSYDNLIRLCSSCHKKEEYSLGRTRRGEKGYPSLLIPIKNIIFNGEVDTYDVTMDGPDHNFVVNTGIITCNSHAVSYAMNGYYSAYCKAHFPIQFFTSYLYFSHEKQKPKQEVLELVNEARLMNIDILPPDIRNLQARFSTDGDIITFGLTDIKGIGASHVAKLTKAVKDQEGLIGKPLAEWTWFEILTRLGPTIGESVLSKLIAAGGLRHYYNSRTKALSEVKQFYNLSKGEISFLLSRVSQHKELLPALKDMAKLKKEGGGCHDVKRKQTVLGIIDMLENPATSQEDSVNWIAGTEELLLGVAITCSRIDGCNVEAINCTCRDYLAPDFKHQGVIILGVEIQSVQEKKTRNGKTPGQKMASLIISDGTAAIDAVCFPDAYKTCSDLLAKGNTIIVEGMKDKKQGGFIIRKVHQADLLGEELE